mmetsp:Transcript_798/g.1751  ORF Transcript_798/g.1751 Transcript_798/m.1751 type:complete len:249 (+) Transcript_798:85-831(+)
MRHNIGGNSSGIIETWVLKLIGNLIVVDAHSIPSQVLHEFLVHLSWLYEFTKVMFSLFVNNVNAKCSVKFLWRPNSTETISIFLGMVPFLHIDLWIHSDNTKETLHCLLACAFVLIGMLPKGLYLASFCLVDAIGIVMEADASFGGKKVVSDGKSSNADRHFFALENHWLILIIGNVYHKMPTRKAKSGGPIWFELWRAFDRGDTLGLTQVTQMLSLRSTFIVGIAHDRSRTAKGSARSLVDGTNNIS